MFSNFGNDRVNYLAMFTLYNLTFERPRGGEGESNGSP